MFDKLKDYFSKVFKSSKENTEKESFKTSKMKKVNLFDKLQFKKLNSKSKTKINKEENNTSKLNIEKLKEAGLVLSAVILIGVGYINFSKNQSPTETIEKFAKSTNNIGDVQLVSSNAVLVNNEEDEKNESDKTEDDKEKTTETSAEVSNANSNKTSSESKEKDNESSSSTSNGLVSNDEKETEEKPDKETATTTTSSSSSQNYFTELKLERNDMYSKSLETYQKIIDSTSITAEQKSIAVQEVEKITSTKNSISVAEELIKLKGFEDVVIYTNDDSISVIVRSATLSETEVAQIQNIVSRELGVQASNINISNK